MRLKDIVHRLPGDDEAIVSVLGAILIAGIIVTLLATIQGVYVPVWEEDSEAAHMRRVAGQFADLKAELNRIVQNATAAPSTLPLSMGEDTAGIFKPNKLPASMEYMADEHAVDLESKQILVFVRNDTDFGSGGPDEAWTPFVGNETLHGITDIGSMRLRFPGICDDHENDWLNLTVRDSGGSKFLGSFNVTVDDRPPSSHYRIMYTVHHRDSSLPLYDQGEVLFNGESFSPFWVDLLDPKYRFDRILNVAEGTMSIFLEDFDGDAKGGGGGGGGGGGPKCPVPPNFEGAEYAIDGRLVNGSGGLEEIRSSGLLLTDFSTTSPTGAFTYNAVNTYFVNQRYVVEHGAIILEQQGKRRFFIPPSFTVNQFGETTQLSLLVPSLKSTGELSTSVSGETTGKVTLTSLRRTSLTGVTPHLHINFTTDYPDLWTQFFEDRLEAAGLVTAGGSPSPSYTLTNTSTEVNLSIYGIEGHQSHPSAGLCESPPTKDPVLGCDFDISVTLKQADVKFEMEG